MVNFVVYQAYLCIPLSQAIWKKGKDLCMVFSLFEQIKMNVPLINK